MVKPMYDLLKSNEPGKKDVLSSKSKEKKAGQRYDSKEKIV